MKRTAVGLLLTLILAGCAQQVGTQIRVDPNSEMGRAMREMDEAQRAHNEWAKENFIGFMSLETMFPDPQVRALARAARAGNVRKIDKLVTEGVDVNAKGKNDAPPLYWAMGFKGGNAWPWSGSVRGFERLLELGADPNVVFGGDTVVHDSVRHPNADFLRAVLAHGGDPNLGTGVQRRTPMYEAAFRGYTEKLLMLLDAGGDIDALTFAGDSLVTAATRNARYDLALLLLDRGADYWGGGLARTLSFEQELGGPGPEFPEMRQEFEALIDWLAARGARVPEKWCMMRPKDAWAGQWEEPPPITDPPPEPPDPSIERFRDSLRSGGEGPEMAVIPAGTYRMGCEPGLTCYALSKPARTVTVDSFAISVHEVTFEEYDRFSHPERVDDAGWGRGDRPVMNVTWHDAKAYAAWLSAETGEGYRLPTEAEWEYAARAGSTTKYPWGNEPGVNRLNCSNRDGCRACGESWEHTAPVGSFAPNAWGLYNMHDNVTEWAEDCWNRRLEGAPADGSAWLEGDCKERVYRGGTFMNAPRDMVSVQRGAGPVDGWNATGTTQGIRIARDLSR